jgi:hypothetical protein
VVAGLGLHISIVVTIAPTLPLAAFALLCVPSYWLHAGRCAWQVWFQVAQRGPQGRRHGRDPHQEHLPARALRTPALPNGQLYDDLSPNWYRRRDPARTTKRLVAQLERPGHTVTLQEAAA